MIGVELIMQKIKQDISLGNNIRTLRKQSHLTQEQIVTHMQLQGIEISRSSYSQIECGTYNIRVSELIALAEIFHVDFNAFFVNLQNKNTQMYQYHKDVKNCLEKLLKDDKITLEEFRKLLITFSNLENYISEKDEYVKQEVASMGDKDYICWSDRIELKAKAENILELLEDLGEIPESTKDKIMKETDFDTLKKWHKLAAKTESIAAFEEEIEKA